MSAGLVVGGIDLEVLRRGAGRPVLLLHGAQTIEPRAPFLDILGQHAEIIAPSHPGFGRTMRPARGKTRPAKSPAETQGGVTGHG